MATYEEIYGKRVKEFDSDPTLESSYEGQVWYDKSTGVLKSVTASIAAWASTGPLIEARSSGAGFGVSTAAVYAGGQQPPGPGAANTFEYNGSGWSTGGSLNTARMELGGTTAGIETAGLCFGGNTAPGWNGTAATEEYNGTAWTSVNNMATTVSSMGGSGIQTAAFSAGGRTPSNTNNSQEYDGTDWSNGNNINTTRQFLAGMGTQTAGIIAGGEAPGGGSNSAETYDGTNFTAAPNMGTARYRLSGSGSDSTACLVFGGRFNPPAADKAQTESFDGTSWTETADLATARQQLSGNRGTSSSAIAAGGLPPPASQTTDTEEFTQSINTITAAAWASGGALNTARFGSGQMGSQTAGLVAGGSDLSGKKNESEEYNGTSWTEGNNLNTARGLMAAGGNSTQTAGLCFGGTTSTGPDNPGVTNATEEYDGSSWTSVNNMNYSARNLGGLGTQTSALSAGGVPVLATSGEYDGTNWTAGTSLPAGLQDNYGMTGETLTAGLLAGGEGPPGSTVSNTFEYDGTNWTAGGTLPTATRENGMSGIQTAALMFGGADPSTTGRTIGYDGTAWSTRPSLGTARAQAGGAGTATAAFCAGGLVPSPGATTATEEFTGATETATASTLTTS